LVTNGALAVVSCLLDWRGCRVDRAASATTSAAAAATALALFLVLVLF